MQVYLQIEINPIRTPAFRVVSYAVVKCMVTWVRYKAVKSQ